MVLSLEKLNSYGLVRMSWSPSNLVYLWMRYYGPLKNEHDYRKSRMPLATQQFYAKRYVKGYFGSWLPEYEFRKWIPANKPNFVGNETPRGSLLFMELERRLDIALFRCCFAPDVMAARGLIQNNNVFVNGKVAENYNLRLEPGDIINVAPQAIHMLRSSADHSFIHTTPESSISTSNAEKSREQQQRKDAEAAMKGSSSETEEEGLQEQDEVSTETETQEGEDQQVKQQSKKKVVEYVKSTPLVPTLKTKNNNDEFGFPSTRVQQRYVKETLGFKLPEYAAPFLFIPEYWEVDFNTCSAIFLRPPTAAPNYSEIPCPFDSEGEPVQLTTAAYVRAIRQNRRRLGKQKKFDDKTPVMTKRLLGLRFKPAEDRSRAWTYIRPKPRQQQRRYKQPRQQRLQQKETQTETQPQPQQDV